MMKAIRYLVLMGMALASLCVPRSACAQVSSTPTAAPVVVVPPNGATAGDVPNGIKALITSFDQLREKFLAAQNLLQIQLKHATTAAERQQIREELQANRQAFLAALKSIRLQLKDELAALKNKISHQEFL